MWREKYTVRSESNPKVFYVVGLNDRNEFGCSCPRWKFKREHCKHIQTVERGGGLYLSENNVAVARSGDPRDVAVAARVTNARTVRKAPVRVNDFDDAPIRLISLD